jgi:hypothetical protein
MLRKELFFTTAALAVIPAYLTSPASHVKRRTTARMACALWVP